jgi:formyltetrahydrofolate hydrolase
MYVEDDMCTLVTKYHRCLKDVIHKISDLKQKIKTIVRSELNASSLFQFSRKLTDAF